MRYMVVETFLKGARPVYERLAERGRMMPDGLVYEGSWIDERLNRCFQLMSTDDVRLFDDWTAEWSDLMEFEIVPVVDSAEARSRAIGTA